MKRHLRNHGQSTDWQMLQTLENAIEEGSASLDLDAADSPIRRPKTAGNDRHQRVTIRLSLPRRKARCHRGSRPAELAAARYSTRARSRPLPESANQTHEEIPLPLDEIAPPFVRPPESRRPSVANAPPARAAMETSNGASDERAEKTAHVTLPRLSELRGMSFSQALRDLDSPGIPHRRAEH